MDVKQEYGLYKSLPQPDSLTVPGNIPPGGRSWASYFHINLLLWAATERFLEPHSTVTQYRGLHSEGRQA